MLCSRSSREEAENNDSGFTEKQANGQGNHITRPLTITCQIRNIHHWRHHARNDGINRFHKRPTQRRTARRRRLSLSQIEINTPKFHQRPNHRGNVRCWRQDRFHHKQRPGFTRMEPRKRELQQPCQEKRYHLRRRNPCRGG